MPNTILTEISDTSHMRGGGLRQLSRAKTLLILPYAHLVPEIHRAAEELRLGKIVAPDRQVLPAVEGAGVLMCMPVTAADLAVVKLITVLPENGAAGRPMVQGHVSVFDPGNGEPIALLDAEAVTARRTAAVSLAGAERLLKSPPGQILIIGSGTQAEAHIEAFADYLGTRRFVVAARSPAAARRLQQRITDVRAGLDVTLIGLDMLAGFDWSDVQVVVCATAARSPVLPDVVPPSVLVVAVGAYRPDMAELCPELIRRRVVVVDNRSGARHEAGDLINANIDWSSVRELSELTDNESTPEQGWLFKSVGHAAWDLAACRIAIEQQCAAGTATPYLAPTRSP